MDKLPHFNQQQLEFFQDTRFLLTKREIFDQLQNLFAITEKTLVDLVRNNENIVIPENALVSAGKISRGENYRGLPYLVLDYPRLFKQKDIFTFRTMCWWGNFFSCTLHLQGNLAQQYRPSLEQSLVAGSLAPDTYLCVNNTPWEYHFGPDNFKLLNKLSESEIQEILQRDFIKLSRKIGLEEYIALPSFASSCLVAFLALLK